MKNCEELLFMKGIYTSVEICKVEDEYFLLITGDVIGPFSSVKDVIEELTKMYIEECDKRCELIIDIEKAIR